MLQKVLHVYWVPQANGGAPGEDAYHVQVKFEAETKDEKDKLGAWEVESTLDMLSATEKGFTVDALKKLIDVDLMKRVDSAQREIAVLKEEAEKQVQDAQRKDQLLLQAANEITELRHQLSMMPAPSQDE